MQAVAWVATLLGWAAAWIVGSRHRHGWLIGIAAACVWAVVDWSFGIWAGVVASVVAGGIAARNWLRHEPKEWT